MVAPMVIQDTWLSIFDKAYFSLRTRSKLIQSWDWINGLGLDNTNTICFTKCRTFKQHR